jgi:hypothetical protein
VITSNKVGKQQWGGHAVLKKGEQQGVMVGQWWQGSNARVAKCNFKNNKA